MPQCLYCAHSFLTQQHLDRHLSGNGMGAVYINALFNQTDMVCEPCGKSFIKKERYEYHMSSKLQVSYYLNSKRVTNNI